MLVVQAAIYPWGSGKDPLQRSHAFKTYYDEMKNGGLSDSQIAEGLLGYQKDKGEKFPAFSTVDLRAVNAIATERINASNRSRAEHLCNERKMSRVEAGKIMGGVSESTVRGWLAQGDQIREGSLRATANALKTEVANKGFVDIGKGTELYMGVAATKLKTAASMLRDEGYNLWHFREPQAGNPTQKTNLLVLAPPDAKWHDARDAVDNGRIKTVAAQSDDGGSSFIIPKNQKPVAVDAKRVNVRWGPDGGAKMDGVIELRRDVPDLNMGASKYAQVRINVNDTHYLKGMAIYADDLPKGVDIRFNTNKEATSNKLDAMKPLKMDPSDKTKLDPNNIFGASYYHKSYVDKAGNTKLSALNVLSEEGHWDDWSKTLSSQMLSKQSVGLATQQLGEARKSRETTYNELLSLTNPVVKKRLLNEFADEADAAAVHLKAASLPRQASRVLLPLSSIRPNEIYAPGFNNGEKVVLIRHPHAGPFEIPELTVNNKSRLAARVMGGAQDAVGIHHSVAEKLSGADFDGDSVLVIPNDSGKVKHAPVLEGLKGFDAKARYKIPDEDMVITRMTKKSTQQEMGKISNLITDMSIRGASTNEMARAVKHSMVVIDAEKHGLDYKQSAIDNNIKDLKIRYQGKANAGASTLISRSSSEASVAERRQLFGKDAINPKTGEKVFRETGRSYVNKKGVTVTNTTKGTKMEFAKDARELLSGGLGPGRYASRGTAMEKVYADYANSMKDLGNKARLASYKVTEPPHSKTAARLYEKEVRSLDNKIKVAQRNAPLERRANIIANAMIKAKLDADPGMSKDDIKKMRGQTLTLARLHTGASKNKIGAESNKITPNEWRAIQAGAISKTKLNELLANADMDVIKDLSMPKTTTSITNAQESRIRQLGQMGRSPLEIADALGISQSTVRNHLNA